MSSQRQLLTDCSGRLLAPDPRPTSRFNKSCHQTERSPDPGDPVHVTLQVLLHLLPGSQLLEVSSRLGLFSFFGKLSREDTENEVHDEERAEDDHGDEVEPLPSATLGVVDPVEHIRPALQGDALEDRQHGLPDIVEVCDPVLRALPVVSTDSPIRTLIETSTGGGLLGHLPCRMISYSGIQWTTILGNKLYTQKSYLVRVTEGRIEFKVIS